MKTYQIALTALALMTSFSTAQAENSAIDLQNDQINFIEQVAANSGAVIQPGSPADDKLFLGRLTNTATSQSIEIFCITGTREACAKIGFFKMNGVIAAEPFKIFSTNELDQSITQKQPRKFNMLPIVNHEFHLNNRDRSDDHGMFIFTCLFGIGEGMLAVDLVSAPVRAIFHGGKASKFNTAKRNLYKALTSGSTVMLSDRQYQNVLNIL